MGEPIFPNKRIDKIYLTSLKRNPTIPTSRPREYINLTHIGRKPAERLVHPNMSFATRQKGDIASGR